jgi:phosphoglycerate dehydrogenase-like enzyme
MPTVVFIGAPEADADAFQQRIRADIPSLDLFATNQRSLALENLAGCEVLIGHHFQFDDALLERAPRLKWIQSLTSGTDAILKLAALRSEVVVTSTRGMHGPQMSELVFLAMLALTRDFPRMLRNQAQKVWERWPQPLLHGKRAVIVGVGAISASLAPRCKSFGMEVYGVTGAPRAAPAFDRMFPREQLKDAAALADYLIVIVSHQRRARCGARRGGVARRAERAPHRGRGHRCVSRDAPAQPFTALEPGAAPHHTDGGRHERCLPGAMLSLCAGQSATIS